MTEEEPRLIPIDTEMREVTFPDGSSGIIAVKRGLPRDEADLMAAQVWAEIPTE